jgi:hypothetical protein
MEKTLGRIFKTLLSALSPTTILERKTAFDFS